MSFDGPVAGSTCGGGLGDLETEGILNDPLSLADELDIFSEPQVSQPQP